MTAPMNPRATLTTTSTRTPKAQNPLGKELMQPKKKLPRKVAIEKLQELKDKHSDEILDMFDAQEEEEKKLQKLIDNAFDKKEAR